MLKIPGKRFLIFISTYIYSCMPFFLQIAIYTIIIYIPQCDKPVNSEFSFMNVGFFIAANVCGRAIHKIISNVNCLYISGCHKSRAEKEALK